MKYYHITKSDTNTIQSISMFGLECNMFGEIFLFENKSIFDNGISNCVSDCIAANQIFLNEYAMFEINPKGIKTELIPDNVGESSAKLQWYIKQKKIYPSYIKYWGTFKNIYKPFRISDYLSNNTPPNI